MVGAKHELLLMAMVKSVKKAFKKAIGEAVLTPFELYICLLKVANLVNQRPIGRIPNDPDDGAYLCPNNILLEEQPIQFLKAHSIIQKIPAISLNCQKIVDSFWKKWSRDVLPSLVARKKWNAYKRNIAVNDFVITADSNAVRRRWCVGKIL